MRIGPGGETIADILARQMAALESLRRGATPIDVKAILMQAFQALQQEQRKIDLPFPLEQPEMRLLASIISLYLASCALEGKEVPAGVRISYSRNAEKVFSFTIGKATEDKKTS